MGKDFKAKTLSCKQLAFTYPFQLTVAMVFCSTADIRQPELNATVIMTMRISCETWTKI